MTFDDDNPFLNPEPWEEALYEQFPSGADHGYGPDQGYNTYRKLNDSALFREDLLNPDHPDFDATLAEFVASGDRFSISFAQFKSSSRESEWAIHKPHLTMAGEINGVNGPVDKFPGSAHAHIATLIINHDRTMARWKQSVVIIENGEQAGQMIYKEEDPSQG
jgi:hypothetical protein